MRIAVIALLLAVALALPAAAQPRTPLDARDVLRAMEEAFAAVADRVTPAVVNVVAGSRKGARSEDSPHSGEGRASGSGVIVDPAGYILTNDHVIENAAEITVRLSDQRKFSARLVGRDPKTDLAVLKIEAPVSLPAAELGDSDRLRVGQWAIAIGSPFGLDRSVTVGIISATARTRVGLATYEKFIQTDASINPGNSGGPLLDIDGRVIGINTAIVAAGQGIGFSIPINMARDVMRDLIARGRVVRGWLGIVIQDVTDELAESFGVPEQEGVLVAEVMSGGPAEAAGLRPGDVVVAFGGSPTKDVPELQGRVAATVPGQSVPLRVIRDHKPIELTITVGEMPAEPTAAAVERPDAGWGLTAAPLSPEMAQRLGLPAGRGLAVTMVTPGSAAEKAGLQHGDVILEVGQRPVSEPGDLARALAPLKPGDSVPLYIHRPGGQKQYLALERPQP